MEVGYFYYSLSFSFLYLETDYFALSSISLCLRRQNISLTPFLSLSLKVGNFTHSLSLKRCNRVSSDKKTKATIFVVFFVKHKESHLVIRRMHYLLHHLLKDWRLKMRCMLFNLPRMCDFMLRTKSLHYKFLSAQTRLVSAIILSSEPRLQTFSTVLCKGIFLFFFFQEMLFVKLQCSFLNL